MSRSATDILGSIVVITWGLPVTEGLSVTEKENKIKKIIMLIHSFSRRNIKVIF